MAGTVRLITLGCAKNEVDSEEIAGVLQRAGYRLDTHTDAPDVIVINTCGFLESAQREGLQVIREALQLKRQGKTQRVIVAGCMVQRLGESLRQMLPEVDAWVGVGQMARFAEIVDSARTARQPITDIQPPHHRWADVPTRLRSRAPWTAYLKVSEGCDHQCTFCTIPSFRGRHVSKPLERVLEEARWLAQHGAKEINLIAQDTTQYGYDLYKQCMLPTLLRELNAIEGIEWIRIHYAYPSRVTDELIEAMASLPKVAHYLDVPLQHADARILRAMRRPGDGGRYLKMIAKLRAAMPDIAIRTTFIVGFPGEGEAEFQNLLEFMQAAQLDRVGAFIYSREKGTPSAEMPNQVPFRVKRERFDRLMRFQQPISLARNQRLIGKTLRVLIENYSADGKYAIGRSHRDAPDVDGLVYVARCTAQPGEFAAVRITRADVYDVWGEAVEATS
ncbi:MAG: 30S ribosomal protein S12 methylthiotransferase RimO [Fimbriimonadales bacterium]|nr:30S ribosomal protein S12 methylthiotransferase RimO [Fimbriimonadales bacterium]